MTQYIVSVTAVIMNVLYFVHVHILSLPYIETTEHVLVMSRLSG